MKLRNKKTGKIVEYGSIGFRKGLSNGWEDFVPNADSLAELNEEWEDYAPQDPLIKDEKVRNLARGWAELCYVEPQDKLHCCTGHGCSFIQVPASDCQLSIYGTQHGIPEDGDYTIAELCGEEEDS